MKNKILALLLCLSIAVSTAVAQSFSCNAVRGTLTIQFNGCSSSIRWTDDNSTDPIRIISAPDTYTVLCGATPFSFKVTDLSACPSFVCDLHVSTTVNTVTAGQSARLSYTGCSNGTVSWDNGLGNGNNKTVSPSATTTYTATCTPDNGLICSQSVTVNFVECSVMANANPVIISPGGSSTLSYTGCDGGTVDWVTDNDIGVGSGNNVVVSPIATTNYIASCSKGGGYCLSNVTVTVIACTVSASASPQNINAGQSTTLSYTGCSNGAVSWDNGVGNGNNKTVSPSVTTTYTATCTPTGGGSTCTSSITVNVSSCAVNASASPQNINAGQSTMLSYTGCSNGSVSWDNGVGNGNNKTVSPSVNTTYTATCTPTGGGSTCTSSITVNVSNCAVNASASPQNINAGQSTTLSYTGCSNGTVSWDNGAGNGNNKIVSPSITTTYTATCTPTGEGSTCTSSVTVNVSNCAVNASSSPQNINAGQSTTLSYTGCSNGNVSWDNGAGNGNNKTVSPTVTTTYTAICTPSGGGSTCTSSVTVNVSNCAVNASASPQNINAGQSTTLSYTGCSNGAVAWDNGVGNGNNKTVSPAVTTTYTATCTPNGGGSACTSSVTVNVGICQVSAFATNTSIFVGESTTIIYSGCSNGTVNWDNGVGTGNYIPVSPLATTTYTATCIPNGGGNSCRASVTINVTSAPLSIISASSKPTTCFDTQNGSFTVNLNRSIVRGESNFLLSVFRGNSFIMNYSFRESSFTTPSNLASGDYFFVIESFVNNTVSSQLEGNFSITSPNRVNFSVTKTDIKCFGGSDATISLNAQGGTGIFSYILNNSSPVGFTNGGNHTIYAVGPGQNTIRVIDSFDCSTAEQSITVSQPESPLSLVKISQKDPRGFETRDGIAIVQANGGTPQYTFDWTDGQGQSYGSGISTNNENKNNILRGGIYTVKVYDANYATASQKEGCFSQTTFTLTEPPVIKATIRTDKAITCFGRRDGSLLITPSGGVPGNAGYKLSIRNKNDTSSTSIPEGNLFENLSKGDYTLIVTDANDVSKSFDYTLTEPEKVIAQIIGNYTNLCAGDQNGRIELIPSGGKAPYTVNWSNKAKSFSINNLKAGIYSAIVADAAGCNSEIISVTIKDPPKISVSLVINAPRCSNSCDGNVEATVKGGTAPYTFAWTGRTEKTLGLEKLCGNENLAFTVRDANNCVFTQQGQVPRPSALASKIETEKNICQGESILLDATIKGAEYYRWVLPDGKITTQPRLETKLSGIYNLTLADSSKCEFSSTITLKSVPSQGTIRFAVSSVAPANEPVVVLNLSDPAPVQVDWAIPQQAVIEQRTNERLQFRMASIGTYKVGIKARFAQCEMYEEKTIQIVDFVPKTLAARPDNTILKIGPNPSEGDFEVAAQFDAPTSFKLRIIAISHSNDVLADITEQEKVNDFTRKITGLPQGIYLLSLETPAQRITRKIMILK